GFRWRHQRDGSLAAARDVIPLRGRCATDAQPGLRRGASAGRRDRKRGSADQRPLQRTPRRDPARVYAVKWRLELGGVAIALLACGELADPRANRVALSIVPVFDASGVFAGNNADRLRIRVQRENLGTFQTVKDTTVTIDADGTASADINVVLVQSP